MQNGVFVSVAGIFFCLNKQRMVNLFLSIVYRLANNIVNFNSVYTQGLTRFKKLRSLYLCYQHSFFSPTTTIHLLSLFPIRFPFTIMHSQFPNETIDFVKHVHLIDTTFDANNNE